MGEPRLITSTEAAERLGTSPTSIKRWADEGKLRCVRTVGGHRRFTSEDLERFRREEMGAEADVDWWADWTQVLTADEPHELLARVYALRSEHQSWAETCDALGPIIHEIGEAWLRGEMSVVQEHRASAALSRALASLTDTLPIPPDAPRAMLVTLEEEEHTLGLSLVNLALREAGWRTLWSGGRTPLAGLGDALDASRVDLLAVSASVTCSDGALMAARAQSLAELCWPRRIELLLGGAGQWPEPPPWGRRLRSVVGLPLASSVQKKQRPSPR